MDAPRGIVRATAEDLARYANVDPRLLLGMPGGISAASRGSKGTKSRPPLILTYITSRTAGSGSSKTFAASQIGTAAADRLVMVLPAAMGGGGGSLNSLTIGGSDATKVVTSPVNADIASIATLLVPSGATADIVVNWSDSHDGTTISIYTLTGYELATAFDSGSNEGTSSRSASLAYPDGGVAVAIAANFANADMTWSSLTRLYNASNSGSKYSSAGATGLSAATPHTETVTWGGGNHGPLAVASWV